MSLCNINAGLSPHTALQARATRRVAPRREHPPLRSRLHCPPRAYGRGASGFESAACARGTAAAQQHCRLPPPPAHRQMPLPHGQRGYQTQPHMPVFAGGGETAPSRGPDASFICSVKGVPMQASGWVRALLYLLPGYAAPLEGWPCSFQVRSQWQRHGCMPCSALEACRCILPRRVCGILVQLEAPASVSQPCTLLPLPTIAPSCS